MEILDRRQMVVLC